ncbi:hypothetical protein TYRP_013692 [Tyrophagus putrescentiae]|nr:hypothetical protein TYRP_013692 [Tyrophagus putrescentiae]
MRTLLSSCSIFPFSSCVSSSSFLVRSISWFIVFFSSSADILSFRCSCSRSLLSASSLSTVADSRWLWSSFIFSQEHLHLPAMPPPLPPPQLPPPLHRVLQQLHLLGQRVELLLGNAILRLLVYELPLQLLIEVVQRGGLPLGVQVPLLQRGDALLLVLLLGDVLLEVAREAGILLLQPGDVLVRLDDAVLVVL